MAKTLFQMANDWLNVPFRFHGRDKNGCDCVGLVIGVLYENGLMSKQTFTALNKIKYGTNLAKITNSMLFEKLLPYFIEEVISLINHQVKEVKEQAVYCCVEVIMVIGHKFDVYFDTLPKNQQNLINFFIKKRTG